MKTRIAVTIGVLLAFGRIALGADIAGLGWNQSNIATLRSFDKAAVVRFINKWSGSEGTPDAVKESQVSEFQWIDLAGDGTYQLAVVASESPCCVDLWLYWRDAAGKVSGPRGFDGAGPLSKTIRDLNGDGKDELILSAYVGTESYQGVRPQATWLQVYRLENGKYVEASRDFPDFYDHEVLPDLEKQMNAEFRPEIRAKLIMERDKVLRVLGRDPSAGLGQAREWAAGSDPEFIGDAIVVFRDIGGYEGEARAATEGLKRALVQQRAAGREVEPHGPPVHELESRGPGLTGGSGQSSGEGSAPGAIVHDEGKSVSRGFAQ